MASKGRVPPPHMRRPVPGPGMGHPDPFGPGVRPPGAFPHFDMLPLPEIMEQKVASQHAEMQKIAFENQRLATTHGTLRQELAAAQHELQILNAQIGAVKSEREQQMRGLMEKIAKMEAELKTAEPVKSELQKAHAEAQSLVVAREELFSKVHQLSQDLQRIHTDVQQIPAVMTELESVRQEYQHCRSTYEYEKKLYNDHLESLQVMEKNYIAMAREVEKLRGQLTNSANVDRRAGGPYANMAGKNENEAAVHPTVQNSYEDAYGVQQGHGSVPLATGPVQNTGAPTLAYAGAQSGSVPARPGYDSLRGPGYDTVNGHSYDPSRPTGYDAQRALGYDPQTGLVYDPQRGPVYNTQRVTGYDMQRGAGATSYDATCRVANPSHGQATPQNNVTYGSSTPPAPAGNGYEAQSRGRNAAGR